MGIIRSLDHTKKYYKDRDAFRNVLYQLASRINNFSGASYGDTAIAPAAIRKRALILVLPENDLSAEQQAVLDAFSLHCMDMGVALKVERYQRSE